MSGLVSVYSVGCTSNLVFISHKGKYRTVEFLSQLIKNSNIDFGLVSVKFRVRLEVVKFNPVRTDRG